MNPTPSSPQWLFVTAAKGLQGYVLRSDPLKEMIGASELIESLPRTKNKGFLAQVLSQLDLQGEPKVLTDASGAARILFDVENDARRLARLWPVLAAQFAPGLEISVALVQVENGQLGAAIKEAEREINVSRNLTAAALPEAGPWVARNRRTGLPAARLVEALDEEDENPEAVDEESARKREATKWTSADTLLGKVVPQEHQDLVPRHPKDWERIKRWPLDLTELVTSDNSYIAIIHADANGLGTAMSACVSQLERSAGPSSLYTALCRAIEAASVAAAQAAMRPVLEAVKRQMQAGDKPTAIVPARVIVCAGEDFTCVIRAEHAVAFAEDYLIALERETAAEFAKLPEKIAGLEGLTACAGVVFCKSHFPFSRAYALAENLCSFAKKQTQRKASALAFMRLKSSLQPSDDYELVVEHAFQSRNDTDRVLLTMNPYAVGGQPANGLPRLSDLCRLKEALAHDRLPRSGLRGVVTRAYEGRTAADQAFERFCLVVQERDAATDNPDRKALPPLESALHALTDGGL